MKKRSGMKNVYVVKSAIADIDDNHKELEAKNIYLLKSDDQVVNRFRDIVLDFVEDDDGIFLVVGQDKAFFQNFRKSFYKELQIDLERIMLVPNGRRALDETRVHMEYQKLPLLFVESTMERRSSLAFIEEFKAEFKDVLVIVLMTEADERLVAQFVEAGADNFITKPASVNVLIEKIANTIEPPDQIGKMIREGKSRLKKIEFALAYGVARDILELKPGSPAGLMIMGDALKGLCKRDDALKMYVKASENAPMYLEPLIKIVEFFREEGDLDNALEYLKKIDTLSPLHFGRKKEIGELLFLKGDIALAAKYYEEAVRLVHSHKLPECVQMCEDFSDKVYNSDPGAACSLFELCSRLADIYKTELDWPFYSRLGMLLRRQKRWEESVKAYSLASQKAPHDENILFNMGMAYVEGKDYRSAAQKFEQAIGLNASFFKGKLAAAYVMGQVFIKAEKKKNALLVLRYVYSEDPTYKKVEKVLNSIK